MADNFSALFQAELNTAKFLQQVQEIQDKQYKISNFKAETAALINEIQSELSKHKFDININPVKMSGDMQSAGSSAASSFAKGFQSGISGIKGQVKITANTIDELRTSLSKIGVDKSSISNVTKDLENLDIAIKRITSREKGNTIRFDIQGLDKSGNIVTTFREIETETGKLISQGNTLTQTFDAGEAAAKRYSTSLSQAMNLQGAPEKMTASIAQVTAQYERLGTTGHSKLAVVQQDLNTLNSLQATISSASGDELVAAYDKWDSTLSRVKSNLSTISAESKTFVSSLQITNLDNQISTWMSKNSKASKDFGSAIQSLRDKLTQLNSSGNATVGQFKQVENEFNSIKAQATSLGKTGQSLGTVFKQSFTTVSKYISSAQLIYRAVAAMKEMYQNVVNIDTAMTGLYRVTNLTKSGYTDLFNQMKDSAKEYGATLKDIVDLTTGWVKLGFDTDTAEGLAEITTQYQHVTDLDTDTATKNLITAYKGFQEQLDEVYQGNTTEAVSYLSDIYDKLGNEFALSAADVGAAMERSASALSEANNSIQESTGLATGMIEVIQNAEKAGTVLNTTSLRLRGMKGELEELGEEVDENVESVSQMQTHILNLTNGKVNIFEDSGDFKSTYQILKEISEVYDDLSDTAQADLLESISGKRNANAVAAVINNFDQVEKATQAATDATGTAANEQAKYMNSIQGHLNQLQASWESYSTSLVDSEGVKTLIDMGSGLLQIFEGVNNTFGTLPTLISVAMGALSFKNIGRTKMFVLINMPIAITVLFRYRQFRYCGE